MSAGAVTGRYPLDMPSNTTTFPNTIFPPAFYRKLTEALKDRSRRELTKYLGTNVTMDLGTPEKLEAYLVEQFDNGTGWGREIVGHITVGNSRWEYSSLQELMFELRSPHDAAFFQFDTLLGRTPVTITEQWGSTTATIKGQAKAEVSEILAIFMDDAHLYEVKAPAYEPERARIFIGHGASPDWQALKTYLSDEMQFTVEAYETLPRAGFDIKEILETALNANNFALLVMTAEDQQADESFNARQNVVHEAGLFQGRVGFRRAIVILEESTAEFSNIAGVQQLRYSKGSIRSIFGDVISTLNREFPQA
jgi:predicted nucleotide-binding protein